MAGKRKRGSQDGGDKSRNAKVAKKEVDGLLTASAASITVHHSLKGKIQTAEGNILVQTLLFKLRIIQLVFLNRKTSKKTKMCSIFSLSYHLSFVKLFGDMQILTRIQ